MTLVHKYSMEIEWNSRPVLAEKTSMTIHPKLSADNMSKWKWTLLTDRSSYRTTDGCTRKKKNRKKKKVAKNEQVGECTMEFLDTWQHLQRIRKESMRDVSATSELVLRVMKKCNTSELREFEIRIHEMQLRQYTDWRQLYGQRHGCQRQSLHRRVRRTRKKEKRPYLRRQEGNRKYRMQD